jgi:hypothetical protein
MWHTENMAERRKKKVVAAESDVGAADIINAATQDIRLTAEQIEAGVAGAIEKLEGIAEGRIASRRKRKALAVGVRKRPKRGGKR